MPMVFPSLITVRSASSRLPEKCFLPFGRGTVLDHIIRRALHYGLEPIVCTSDETSDDRVEKIAINAGVKCFRGEPVHKLKRWADCCAAFEINAFHTVDADDPFFDGDEMKGSFQLLINGNWDIVEPSLSSSSGGGSVGYSLTKDIVDRAVTLTSRDEDTEMMWYWLEKVPNLKKTKMPDRSGDPIVSRITLDYEEDYWLISTLLRLKSSLATRESIESVFRENPDFYKINWFRNQQWIDGQDAKKPDE